ncbi:MAG TPA: substrate-binding domain-containing protein [Vicinamibacterales bacterium]
MSSAFPSVAAAAVLSMAAVSCARPAPVPDAPSRVLRVCADPNNLPFSNRALEGFENRIASLVADRLDAKVEYEWWAQRRGFVRNTLRAGLCDVVMGLPSRMEMAATTQPYYRSSYMFVTRRGTHQPASFDDAFLKTAKVGVHIIGDDFSNSPPAHALSNRGLIDNVRGYSVYGNYKSPNPPAELIRAVEQGEIDVAIAWGPLAGYFAQVSKVPLQLTRVMPEREPPFPFVFDMSMAVARSNTALKDELDKVITDNKPAIDAILRAFAVPIVDDRKVASR